jgi:type I restriction enzyme S subunit
MVGEWPKVPVSRVATAVIGGTPSRNVAEYWHGDIPWATAKDVAAVSGRYLTRVEEYITDDGLENSAAKLLPKGTVVMTARGTVGAVAQLGRAMAFNQTCYGLIPEDTLDNAFLFYALKATLAAMRALTYGTVFETITTQTFNHWLIPLPPLPEQRAIAHILGTLDDKIELNRRMGETLEAMARALFKAWFVDFEPVRAKMEGRWRRGQSLPGLPAHLYDLFPTRLVDSELGEIPEGWRVARLGDFVVTIKGRSYKSEDLVEGSDVALVTLKSFARGGGYRPDGLKPFAGCSKQEQVVKPGEVVVACTDVTQAAEVIGRAAMVPRSNLYRELVASLDTLIVRPKTSDMTVAFLYSLLRTDAFVEHTYAHVTGTTVLHLGKDAVPSYSLALPSKTLADVFDGIGSRIFAKIEALELESGTLAALRDALLPKLIRGEIRVRDAEKFILQSAQTINDGVLTNDKEKGLHQLRFRSR